MKPHECLLAILLACCGATASADVVVLANRTRGSMNFELADEQGEVQKASLASGATRAFSTRGQATVYYSEDGESRRYELQPGAVYYFHDRGGAGPKELAHILLRRVDQPPIADDKKDDKENGPPQRAPSEARVGSDGVFRLPVKILVDDDQRAARQYWEARLRRRLAAASHIFERSCGIGFELAAADVWDSSDRLGDFEATFAEFEREVDPAPGRLAIGFTSQHVLPFGQLHADGFRGPLGKHVLLRESSQYVSEAERTELLVHELGHWLGAVHCPESNSVMRPLLADRQALSRRFPIGFDPLNTLAMATVADELRERGVEHFGALSVAARRRLRDVYATLLESLPSDPAGEIALGHVGDPIPVRIASPKEVAAERDDEEVATLPARDGDGDGANVESQDPPLVTATRAVVRAISTKARQFQNVTGIDTEASSGQERLSAYFRAAADAASQQPPDVQTQAFLLALAIGLDRSDSLRKYAVMSDLVASIEPDEERDRRLEVLGTPTMHQRHDLVQHFVLSAAIASSSGERSAEAVALAKQLHDARYGGGFSFAAWCADLSGIAFSRRVTTEQLPLAELAKSFRVESVLPNLDGLPERLSMKEFKTRYGSASDERFRELDGDIRRRIAGLVGARTDAAD